DDAHGAVVKENHVLADGRMPLDHRMGADPRALVDLHVGPDDGVGPHLYRRVQLGRLGDDGRRVNPGHGFTGPRSWPSAPPPPPGCRRPTPCPPSSRPAPCAGSASPEGPADPPGAPAA